MFTKHAELLFEKEAKVTPSVAFQKLKEILTGKQFIRGMGKLDKRKDMQRQHADYFKKKRYATPNEKTNAMNRGYNLIDKNFPIGDAARDIFGGAAKTTAAYALPVVGAHTYLKSKDVDPFDPKNYEHLQ